MSFLKKYKLVFAILLCINILNASSETIDQAENTEDTDGVRPEEKPLLIYKETLIQTISKPEFGTFVMFYAPWW
jgi:hypothetical protein